MASFALKPVIADFLEEVTAPSTREAAVADLMVKGSQLGRRSIRDLQKTGVAVLALQRKGATVLINPKADLPIEIEDRLIVLGDSKAIEAAKNLVE